MGQPAELSSWEPQMPQPCQQAPSSSPGRCGVWHVTPSPAPTIGSCQARAELQPLRRGQTKASFSSNGLVRKLPEKTSSFSSPAYHTLPQARHSQESGTKPRCLQPPAQVQPTQRSGCSGNAGWSAQRHQRIFHRGSPGQLLLQHMFHPTDL